MSDEEPELDVYQVVKKLIGPIEPVGETHTDKERLENLARMTALMDKIHSTLDDLAWSKRNHYEHSIKQSVKHINEFFDRIGIKAEE